MGHADRAQTAAAIKTLASDLGFDLCGVARAEPLPRTAYLKAWLDAGKPASMAYLHNHFNLRSDPGELIPGARSVIVTGLSYHQPEPSIADDDRPRGRMAMYAWGQDYHRIVKEKLWALADRIREMVPPPFDCQACVDTVPILERELAARAGIGWIGKNTLVLNPSLGSYFFLGELVTTLDLPPDEPEADHCGTCTACLDACPTGAFPAPYEMDPRRCISYLTIEHRDAIPAELQAQMSDWVFGCDICQQVCPHNRHAPHTNEPRFAPRDPAPRPPLGEVLGWTEESYRDALRRSAARRATLAMWQRNARIAEANLSRDARENEGG